MRHAEKRRGDTLLQEMALCDKWKSLSLRQNFFAAIFRTNIIQTGLNSCTYMYYTASQLIPDRRGKWSSDRKWSPNWTTNDPEPQMIPDVDRKWSHRKTRNGMELLFIYLFFNI